MIIKSITNIKKIMEDSLMSFLKISNIARTGSDNRVQTNKNGPQPGFPRISSRLFRHASNEPNWSGHIFHLGPSHNLELLLLLHIALLISSYLIPQCSKSNMRKGKKCESNKCGKHDMNYFEIMNINIFAKEVKF